MFTFELKAGQVYVRENNVVVKTFDQKRLAEFIDGLLQRGYSVIRDGNHFEAVKKGKP